MGEDAQPGKAVRAPHGGNPRPRGPAGSVLTDLAAQGFTYRQGGWHGGSNRINYGSTFENVLYTYLQARGYQVSVGKIGKLECDFITRKANDHAYMQVAFSIAERSVGEREYRPFSRTRDAYLLFLFTLDPLLQRRDGVLHLNLLDFMASGLGLEDARAGGPPLDNGAKREPSQEKSPLNEALRRLVWVAASANRVATVYTSAPLCNRRLT